MGVDGEGGSGVGGGGGDVMLGSSMELGDVQSTNAEAVGTTEEGWFSSPSSRMLSD